MLRCRSKALDWPVLYCLDIYITAKPLPLHPIAEIEIPGGGGGGGGLPKAKTFNGKYEAKLEYNFGNKLIVIRHNIPLDCFSHMLL